MLRNTHFKSITLTEEQTPTLDSRGTPIQVGENHWSVKIKNENHTVARIKWDQNCNQYIAFQMDTGHEFTASQLDSIAEWCSRQTKNKS